MVNRIIVAAVLTAFSAGAHAQPLTTPNADAVSGSPARARAEDAEQTRLAKERAKTETRPAASSTPGAATTTAPSK